MTKSHNSIVKFWSIADQNTIVRHIAVLCFLRGRAPSVLPQSPFQVQNCGLWCHRMELTIKTVHLTRLLTSAHPKIPLQLKTNLQSKKAGPKTAAVILVYWEAGGSG